MTTNRRILLCLPGSNLTVPVIELGWSVWRPTQAPVYLREVTCWIFKDVIVGLEQRGLPIESSEKGQQRILVRGAKCIGNGHPIDLVSGEDLLQGLRRAVMEKGRMIVGTEQRRYVKAQHP